MRKKIILSVLLLTGILVTKPLPVFGQEHNVEISSGEIRSFVDSYLHSKSLRDYGLDNPTISLQNYSELKSIETNKKDEFVRELTTFRMNSTGIRALSVNTENTVQNIEMVDGRYVIKANSLVKIQFKGIEGLSQKVVNHNITLSKDGNNYMVHKDETKDDIYDYLLESNKSYDEILIEEKNNTIKSIDLAGYEKEVKNEKAQIVPLALNTLNRNAMGNYMLNNWNKRPSNWGNFDGMGGDCTNYASQVIYAGGAPMNTTSTTKWYYNSYNDRAPSWTSVVSLYNFLVNNTGRGPRATSSSLVYLEKGDLVQLSDGSTYYHTLLIVNPYGTPPSAPDYSIDINRINAITISAHTTDRYNYPLNLYTSNRRSLHLTGYSY